MASIDIPKLKEILLREKYITSDALAQAETSSRERKLSLIEFLSQQGIISRNILGQAVAESLNLPYADLSVSQPSKEKVLKIPEKFAKEFHIILFREEEKSVIVAADNFPIAETAAELQKIFPNKKISFVYSFPEDITEALLNYRQSLEARFVKIINEKNKVAPGIIEEILEDALASRASDIHFEPLEKETNIRFRIDGIMREVGRIPKDQYGSILNRIKVQAHLRIDEHFSAQDGAIRYTRNGKITIVSINISKQKK